jgi:hypothetical protein
MTIGPEPMINTCLMLLSLGMGREEVIFYLGPNWRKIRKIIRRGKEKYQFHKLSRAPIFWRNKKPLS